MLCQKQFAFGQEQDDSLQLLYLQCSITACCPVTKQAASCSSCTIARPTQPMHSINMHCLTSKRVAAPLPAHLIG
jgi:hypothetical protein